MSGELAPIIIKKKKVSGGDGHHGGAWKVAYADFVTAMMAFFLLMWLLNATTEQQRKGLADYFSPTIPVNRISGGGDGAFGGDDMFAEERLAENGENNTKVEPEFHDAEAAEGTEDNSSALNEDTIKRVDELLLGRGGESEFGDQALQHIITRLTDEGLVIEVFDLENRPLFVAGTATPEPILHEISSIVAEAVSIVANGIAINGHVQAQPVVLTKNINWDLSSERAGAMRLSLENQGISPDRMARVSGHSDRKPVTENPMEARNSRLEVVLLRSDLDRN